MPGADLQRFFLPLLREHVGLTPGVRVLEQGYYDPAAAVWAAAAVGASGRVLALRPALDLASELERLGQQANATSLEVRLGDALDAGERGSFDTALVLAPFFLGNAPVQRALSVAAAGLTAAGELYFQVHRRHGGNTFVRFAVELFGEVEMLGMGGGQRRLYVARRPKGQPRAAPPDAPLGASAMIEFAARGVALRLKLTAGVFGARGVDPGSRLLVQSAAVPPGARILDLGCGAGVIGLTLAAADKRAHVVLVDVTKAAVDLSRENAALNGLANVSVRLSDGYGAVRGERFDAILSNLPAHRGQQHDTSAAERLVTQAPGYLAEEGEMWVVANKALPYELPAARVFREVRVAARDARYKVLQCRGPRRGGRQPSA